MGLKGLAGLEVGLQGLERLEGGLEGGLERGT